MVMMGVHGHGLYRTVRRRGWLCPNREVNVRCAMTSEISPRGRNKALTSSTNHSAPRAHDSLKQDTPRRSRPMMHVNRHGLRHNGATVLTCHAGRSTESRRSLTRPTLTVVRRRGLSGPTVGGARVTRLGARSDHCQG